ncbi:MAG: site-specific integrase [Pseudomonadota bacterium]
MARKPPEIEHVKWVGDKYAYFNTGKKNARGNPIRVRLPLYSSPDFWGKYAAQKAARTKRATPQYKVRDLVADWKAGRTFERYSENTKSNYSTQTDHICEVWGDFPASDLQPSDVSLVFESGRFGDGTVQMIHAVLGSMYRWGRKNKQLKNNPIKEVDRPEGGTHEPWPEHVLEAALGCDDDLVRLATHLLYFTGQRIGDVCNMRWSDIREGRIYVLQQKTKKVVEPPLAQDMKAELDRHTKAFDYILPERDHQKVRRALQKFTLAMGHKTVPHGLRKNSVNALLEAGCTPAEVSAITAQTLQVVEDYAKRVDRRKLSGSAVVKFDQARRRT